RVRDGQVVGRRQALLLRSVAWVRLDLLVEQLTDERGNELVGRDAAESADGVTAHRVGPGRSEVDRRRGQCQRVADAQDPDAIARFGRFGDVVEDGDQVARGDIARPEAGNIRPDSGNQLALGRRDVQGGPNLARERVGRGE